MALISANMPKRPVVCALAGALLASAAAVACLALACLSPADAFAGELEITAIVGSPVDQTLGTAEITFTVPETPSTPDDPGTGGEGNEGEGGTSGEGNEGGGEGTDPEPEPDPEPTPIPDSYSFAITEGTLPDGLAITMPATDTTVSLRLSGTPTAAGQSFFVVTWTNDTKNTVVDTFAVSIGIFAPPTVAITSSNLSLFDGEVAGFDAVVSGGTGDYGFRWFAVDGTGNATLVGSGMNYLFYPSAGTLLLKDDGLTFYCEVTDRMTNLVGISNKLAISVSCVHKYTEWEEFTPATCTEAQTLVRTCEKCGVRELKTGQAALGHTWGEWRQVDGETMEHVCTVCGETESQAVVAGTPFIRVQPTGGSIYQDESLVLKVEAEATGLGWLTYEWQFATSASGPFETLTGEDGSNNPTCVADRDGYYRVRVTQVAGADSNAVDSVAVRVHVHNMTTWSVDTSSNTATRMCLT